jgi:hypothetical protein
MDPQFADATTHAFPVTKQSRLEPVQPGHDAAVGRAIRQAIQPIV